MKCPECKRPGMGVIDSRARYEGAAVRRRRACDACGFRVTTTERQDAASEHRESVFGQVVELRNTGVPGRPRRMRRMADKAARMVIMLTLITEDDVDLLMAMAERLADATAADATAADGEDASG